MPRFVCCLFMLSALFGCSTNTAAVRPVQKNEVLSKLNAVSEGIQSDGTSVACSDLNHIPSSMRHSEFLADMQLFCPNEETNCKADSFTPVVSRWCSYNKEQTICCTRVEALKSTKAR